MALKWLGTQLWLTVDPPPMAARFVETTAPCEAARVAVAEVLPALKLDLGLDAVTVKWFRPETAERKHYRVSTGSTAWHTFEGEAGLKGQCRGSAPEEIWVRADLDALDAAETLGHELQHSKHYTAFIAGTAEMPNGDEGEQAALDYGKAVRAALLAD